MSACVASRSSGLSGGTFSRISGVALHDYGCTLKAYRRDVMGGVQLYGEMHRFIPIYAAWNGARVTELPGRHHARRHPPYTAGATTAAPESVLARATSDIPRAQRDETAEPVRARLVEHRHTWVCVVAVMHGDVLAGTVAIEDLLPAPAPRTMASLMRPAVTVHRDTDQEVAAWEMGRKGHRALAEVDDAGHLPAVVTPAHTL